AAVARCEEDHPRSMLGDEPRDRLHGWKRQIVAVHGIVRAIDRAGAMCRQRGDGVVRCRAEQDDFGPTEQRRPGQHLECGPRERAIHHFGVDPDEIGHAPPASYTIFSPTRKSASRFPPSPSPLMIVPVVRAGGRPIVRTFSRAPLSPISPGLRPRSAAVYARISFFLAPMMPLRVG